jgi:hypothetical protein
MNFNNFGLAIITLIRCATGEHWNFIMDELAIDTTTPVIRAYSNGSIVFEYCANE